MTASNINYDATYFEYPTIIKIMGQPNYDGIKTLKDQIKAGLSRVSSDLGDRAYGYLGLGLTAA